MPSPPGPNRQADLSPRYTTDWNELRTVPEHALLSWSVLGLTYFPSRLRRQSFLGLG
ncbi:DUF4113 domain-containing protein [Kocuria atrinae]|uniref:DUF4113 domain-containing protein n=1 Tax=Kocuria atrinae TaxID=592377 RepID=UPI0037BF3AEE